MTCLDWSRENEARLLSECDFGIMPLLDDDFSRGKSAYKLIQYAATGLPAIASPVGENKFFITPGVNGFTASTAEEWLDAVRQLKNLSTRQKMASAMQNKAFDYSLQKYAPVMTEFLLRCFS
jgi:glycosyltransferase involved in cell wall biosynthesis